MSYIEIILIAIGLSMDAFAVSITLGLSVQKLTLKEYGSSDYMVEGKRSKLPK